MVTGKIIGEGVRTDDVNALGASIDLNAVPYVVTKCEKKYILT